MKMKNKLTFLLISGIAMMMAACGGSSKGKPMSGAQLAEYNETVAKVQQIENLLCEVNGMEASDALQLSQLADQLHYTYDTNGLDSASLANCQALQQRMEQLKQNIKKIYKNTSPAPRIPYYIKARTLFCPFMRFHYPVAVAVSTEITMPAYTADGKLFFQGTYQRPHGPLLFLRTCISRKALGG